MKVAIATYLIPAATLILPGCAQLLQGRFNVWFRHVATALLISNLAFFDGPCHAMPADHPGENRNLVTGRPTRRARAKGPGHFPLTSR